MNQKGQKAPDAGAERRADLYRTYREALAQLRSANATLHDLLWSLEELEQRLEALLAQRVETTDTSLNAEIDALQQQRDELEDMVLRRMLETDELAAHVARQRRELQANEDSAD